MSKIAFRSSFMCWWMGVFCSKLFQHRLEHAFKSFVNKIFSDEQAFLHGRYQYLHTYFRFFKCMATDTSLTLIGQIQMYYTCNSIYYVKIVSNWLSYRKYKDIDWVNHQSLSMFSHLVFREIVYGERLRKREIERENGLALSRNIDSNFLFLYELLHKFWNMCKQSVQTMCVPCVFTKIYTLTRLSGSCFSFSFSIPSQA